MHQESLRQDPSESLSKLQEEHQGLLNKCHPIVLAVMELFDGKTAAYLRWDKMAGMCGMAVHHTALYPVLSAFSYGNFFGSGLDLTTKTVTFVPSYKYVEKFALVANLLAGHMLEMVNKFWATGLLVSPLDPLIFYRE